MNWEGLFYCPYLNEMHIISFRLFEVLSFQIRFVATVICISEDLESLR